MLKNAWLIKRSVSSGLFYKFYLRQGKTPQLIISRQNSQTCPYHYCCFNLNSHILNAFLYVKEENHKWDVSSVLTPCYIYLTVSCFASPICLYCFCDEENKPN